MEKIKIVRHLEEEKASTVDRDSDIDPQGLDLLVNHYVPAIVAEVESGKYDHITVVSSDKLRSLQTAQILKDEISKHVEIPVDQEIDPRTSAENHGVYKEGVEVDNPLLKKAQRIYLREAFEKGNVWYRYGATTNDFDQDSYRELEEIFASPGENQIELNIRIYRVILDLIEKIKEDPKRLYVLSTHYVVMSRILSLIHIVDKNNSLFSLSYNPGGKLYQDENIATEEMIGGWDNFYNYFTTNNFVFDADLSKLDRIKNAIQSDLDISVAKYMQHYGKEI